MPLIDDVKAVCDRLAPLGWRNLLLAVTGNALDIRQASASTLQSALLATLPTIDRHVDGFADFAVGGRHAITPGQPGLSLLYHALASPNVAAGTRGPLGGFPTRREIEVVENFVFGAVPPSLAELRDQVGLGRNERFAVVVFAYEYRPAAATCSRLQADLTFSRTGVARVGTRAPQYNRERRGFVSEVSEDPFAFHVCPAQYGAFLSVRRKGSAQGSVPMHFQRGDASLDFWMPIHKLFDGRECLRELDLRLTFEAFHYNDKIRRVQLSLKKRAPAVPPFQFSDGIAEFVSDADLGGGLLAPIPHPRLVEEARKGGNLVTFRVPRNNKSDFAAYEPPATTDPATQAEIRPTPAYVHARTKVTGGTTTDLGNDPQRPDVLQSVRAGNYDALHYVDFTGDGRISVAIPALTGAEMVAAQTIPAYSLVAAPDFFPSAGQRELTEWSNSPAVPPSLKRKIWGVDPIPLCDSRLPANVQMPGNNFDPAEVTITALVPLLGPPPVGGTRPVSGDVPRHSCLPDDAAGVFAPGWDVSTDKTRRRNKTIHHLAAYGLGSPFPEDSKLCAALSTFWATVAPDITRGMSFTTGNSDLRHTVAPLTDEEIGQIGALPWDGNS